MDDSERDTITERDAQVLAAVAPEPRGVPIGDVPAPRQRLRALVEACRIVERAHPAGFVHGALTPRAIVVDELGQAYIVRWGDDRGAPPAEDVHALAAIVHGLAPEISTLDLRTLRDLRGRVLAHLDAQAPPRGEVIQRQSRAGMLALVAYLIFGPAFLWLGAGAPGYALILLALVAANLAVLWLQGIRGHRARPALVAAGNVALVALIACVSSPFLLAPGIAAITTMAIGFSPMYERGAAPARGRPGRADGALHDRADRGRRDAGVQPRALTARTLTSV